MGQVFYWLFLSGCYYNRFLNLFYSKTDRETFGRLIGTNFPDFDEADGWGWEGLTAGGSKVEMEKIRISTYTRQRARDASDPLASTYL